MNILLAFKLEPDASMLAEQEWQAATLGTRGPDTALLRSSPVLTNRLPPHCCYASVVTLNSPLPR